MGARFDFSSILAHLTYLKILGCKTLKANPSDLKLGLNATVTAVKQAKLDQYRIIYFATHGLVSGELERFAKSKAEPA